MLWRLDGGGKKRDVVACSRYFVSLSLLFSDEKPENKTFIFFFFCCDFVALDAVNAIVEIFCLTSFPMLMLDCFFLLLAVILSPFYCWPMMDILRLFVGFEIGFMVYAILVLILRQQVILVFVGDSRFYGLGQGCWFDMV